MSSRRRAWTTALLAGVSMAASCTELLNIDIDFVGDGGGGEGPAGPGGGSSTGGSGPGTTSTTSGSTSSGEGGSGGCDVALAEASDDFDDGNGDGWCELVPLERNDSEAEITYVAGGARVRASTTTSVWSGGGNYAPFLYRRITAADGDFLVAAKLSVSTVAGGDPTGNANGGGILIRRPNPNPGVSETDVLWTRTYYNDVGGMAAIAFKQDAGGDGERLFDPVAGTGTVALAICKQGSTFRFFHHEGGRWSLPQSNNTLGLAADTVLEVGLTAHAYDGGEIVEADFEWVVFESVGASCAAELPDP